MNKKSKFLTLLLNKIKNNMTSTSKQQSEQTQPYSPNTNKLTLELSRHLERTGYTNISEEFGNFIAGLKKRRHLNGSSSGSSSESSNESSNGSSDEIFDDPDKFEGLLNSPLTISHKVSTKIPSGVPSKEPPNERIDQIIKEQLKEMAENFAIRVESKDLLINAVKAKDEKVIDQLIRSGINVNNIDHTNEDYQTALSLSISLGYDGIANKLIKSGAFIDIINADGDMALMWSIKDLSTQQKLSEFQESEANKKDNEKNRQEINQQDIEQKQEEWIREKEKIENIVIQLIKHGANINIANKKGETVLMKASMYGYEKTVKELIKAGANVNVSNCRGYTALMLASDRGHIEIVKQLLKARANVNAINVNGITPLMNATTSGNDKIIIQLLKAGSNINAIDNAGNTALILGVRWPKATEILINNGANITSNEDGYNALTWAIDLGYEDTVELLLQTDIDVNAIDKTGKHPLTYANSHPDRINIINMLINKGSHIDKK